jgi:hypothetical protein
MTWSIASLLLLGLALAGGFAWYERAHPSSRVLALVATLAALAALGRLAFAPLPNIKPTTDIVLIAGAALGGAAGFAVGAVAALTSNLVLGQGYWTPWQMAAWGLCGLLGAALARSAPKALERRLPLAVTCAAAGMMYGAVLDFGTASLAGGDDLWRRFGTMYLGTSLPWNVAHAAGNAAFALAFGPALLRALTRFRVRFSVTWRAAPLAPLAALALLLALVPAALAATPTDYLRGAQNADGGWGGAKGERSSPLYTGWAALGLAAAGTNPLDVRHGGPTPIDLLRRGADRLHGAGDLERTILVLGASGVSARDFGGRDLVAGLRAHRRRDGSFDGQVNLTAFGIFALRAAGLPASDRTVRRAATWLAREQERAGGWNYFRRGGASTADDTGAALQALAAAGRGRTRAARRGAAWLGAHQRRDGGFAGPAGTSNAQSTAWVIQGLVAVGRDPARLHRRHARSPLAYLRSLIAPSGLVRYSRTSAQTPVWVTAQAALALRRRAFPLAPVKRRASPRTPPPTVTPVKPPARPPTPTPRTSAPGASTAGPAAARRRAPRRASTSSPAALAALSRSAGVAAALIFAPLSSTSR